MQASSMAAICEIVAPPSRYRLARWAAASCALGAVFLLASEASAARVSLLGFEGDRAIPIRWRVAQILKRAGHTVLGFSPPRNPDSASALRSYAGRRRVDTFVAGEAVESGDGWELSLTLRDADGAKLGKPLTFTAPTLGALVKELKSEGQGRLDRAIRSGGSASGSSEASEPLDLDDASEDDEADDAPALDLTANMRSRVKNKSKAKAKPKKSKKPKRGKAQRLFKKSRAVEVVLDEDPEPEEEAAASEEAPAAEERPEPREEKTRAEPEPEEEPPARQAAEASGWSTSDSSPFDEDGSSTTSDDDSSSASDEVGVDESTDEEEEASSAPWPTVVVGANAGLVRRTLEYADDLYGRLRAPSANSWVYRLDAAVYPFAKPVKNRIGLIASYESVISGVVRDNTAGTDFGVTHSELFGGVRLRQPIGKHELALEAEVGTLAAGLDDPEGVSRVPEFDYTLLRSSLGLGLHFGPVSARGALGYRLSIGDYGEVSNADNFPRMEGYGVEGSLGLEYQFSKEVAFGVSGSMRRFVLTMNSVPQDAIDGVAEVAAGAVDLYMSGYFGLSITL